MACQAFHLQHIGQSHPPQDAAKSLLRLETRKLMQRGVNRPPATLFARLFQEQFRSVVQTTGAILLRGVAGEDDLEDVRVLSLEQVEEL